MSEYEKLKEEFTLFLQNNKLKKGTIYGDSFTLAIVIDKYGFVKTTITKKC